MLYMSKFYINVLCWKRGKDNMLIKFYYYAYNTCVDFSQYGKRTHPIYKAMLWKIKEIILLLAYIFRYLRAMPQNRNACYLTVYFKNFRSSSYFATKQSIHRLNLLDLISFRWCLKYDKLCTRQTNIAKLSKGFVCLALFSHNNTFNYILKTNTVL